MVFMPAETQGKNRKLALPLYGPYQILEVGTHTLLVRAVDEPTEQQIHVNVDRAEQCSVRKSCHTRPGWVPGLRGDTPDDVDRGQRGKSQAQDSGQVSNPEMNPLLTLSLFLHLRFFVCACVRRDVNKLKSGNRDTATVRHML